MVDAKKLEAGIKEEHRRGILRDRTNDIKEMCRKQKMYDIQYLQMGRYSNTLVKDINPKYNYVRAGRIYARRIINMGKGKLKYGLMSIKEQQEFRSSMPKCYIPVPPFFDFCNNAKEEAKTPAKCMVCREKFGLYDYIE